MRNGTDSREQGRRETLLHDSADVAGHLLVAALFSRIFAINSSDQKKILARLKKMVLEHSQKIGATRQPFLGQLLLFLPTARR